MQLNDEFYYQQMIDDHLFEPIIDMLIDTMPRDNLLNSACLDFFEYICSMNIRIVTAHIVSEYRDKLSTITYVQTFRNLIQRYDHQQTYAGNLEGSFMDTEEDTPGRNAPKAGDRWQGLREMDDAEEAYFNTSDDEDEIHDPSTPSKTTASINGASPIRPLVDYPSDEENDPATDAEMAGILPADKKDATKVSTSEVIDEAHKENASPKTPKSAPPTPPERLSEKRRREEDEEDELAKLSQNKRRSSSVSVGSVAKTITISTKQRVVK